MNVPYNKSPDSSHITAAWYERYFATQPEDCEIINYTTKAEEGCTDIYITTFGNSWFAEYQIKLLRLFFKSPFSIIIIDTNEDLNPEISARLKEICTGHPNVIYLKPPKNHYQEKQHFDPTMKLGTTLSWLFHVCVKQREPKYFGFLDHDCFLFKRTTINNLFLRSFPCKEPFSFQSDEEVREMNMYGTPSCNGEKWNLHVIANFFNFDYVKHLPLDFRASYKHRLDTGGANRDILYADKNLEDYRLSHIGVRYIPEKDISRAGGVQHYEIVDNRWIHSPALGEDQRVGDPGYEKKLMYIRGFLEAALRISE